MGHLRGGSEDLLAPFVGGGNAGVGEGAGAAVEALAGTAGAGWGMGGGGNATWGCCIIMVGAVGNDWEKASFFRMISSQSLCFSFSSVRSFESTSLIGQGRGKKKRPARKNIWVASLSSDLKPQDVASTRGIDEKSTSSPTNNSTQTAILQKLQPLPTKKYGTSESRHSYITRREASAISADMADSSGTSEPLVLDDRVSSSADAFGEEWVELSAETLKQDFC